MNTTLYRYRLARTATGALYAYGYDRATAHVRILELLEFNTDAMTGTANDGSPVVLEGYPALDMNAGWVWCFYCAEHGLGECADVTP